MRRQNQTSGRFLLSAYFLLQFSCTTVSQLQRTSNSACSSIVCPGELVQYECEVGSGINSLVWRVSGCGNPLEIVYQQGMDVQQAEGSCGDGQSITADLQQINASFFRSTFNITGVWSNLTIQCSSDDGSRESLIGMDKLISTAPAPDSLQQLYTDDSRIVVSWEPALEGCSSLRYNFTQSSNTCGTCELAEDGNTVICTDGVVNECTLLIQTVVCGVVVNESVVTNIMASSQTTSSPTTSSDIATSDDFLSTGEIAGIVVAAVVLLVIVTVAALLTCFCCRKRQKRKLDIAKQPPVELSLTVSGEEQKSGSGEVKKAETSLSNDGLVADLEKGLKVLDTSTLERECGNNEHIKSEISGPPPANTSAPANSNDGLEGEVGEANASGSTEDQTDDQLLESTEPESTRSRRKSSVQEEGYDESVEEDHQPVDVTNGEVDSASTTQASSTKKSEASREGFDTQPYGSDVDKTLGNEVDKDLHWPVEESSKDVGSSSEEHVQVTPVSSLTRKDPKQKHKHTEVLPSIGADRQPSLTPTSAIKETSQEPPSPTDPFVNGTRMFPPSSTHRSEPQHFHINPPNDDHAPVQQETEGRAVGATGGGKHSDIMEIRSMLQSMNSKLESMTGNNEKIVAVEKKLDDSVQENKEDMEALEKKLSEKIRKRDKQITKLEKEVSTLQLQCADLERKLQDEGEKHKEELQTLKEKAATELQKKQNEIDKLKNEKEQLKAQFNKKRSSYTSQWGTL